jgi:hypothetical protein
MAPSLAMAQRADTTLSPIPTQDITIVGDLEIIFPQLRRQPLSGFNPPPRIYQIPRGRLPYTDAYKQSTADIPGTSLIQPPTPPGTISVGQHPHNGELIVGVGAYLSREIHGIAAFDLSDAARVHVDLLHDGYETFKPFSDSTREDLEAPFKNFDGKAGIEYNFGASTLGVDATGFAKKYNLYGLQPDTAASEFIDRDGQGFGISGSYQGGATTALPFTIKAGFGSDRYTTMPGSTEIETRESLFDVEAGLDFNLSDNKGRIDGSLGRRSVDDDTLGSTDVSGYHAGGDVTFSLGSKSTLRVGAQIQGYSSSDGHLPDSLDSSKLYVAPRVELRSTLAPGLEFYAVNDPVADRTSQKSIFEKNPFSFDRPLVLPELSVINLEGGLVYFTGPVRISAHGGYTMYDSRLYFEGDSSGVAGYEGNLFATRYGEVDRYFYGADIALAFPGSFSIALTGDWSSSTLESDLELPYDPDFVAGLRATYTFADDRAILQADGKYVGPVVIDTEGSEELDGYLDLSALASYYVTPHIGIYARAESITGDQFQRWAGYPAADWIAMAGIRLRW